MIDKITENTDIGVFEKQLSSRPSIGDFDAGNQLNPGGLGKRSSLPASTSDIVIGDRQRADPPCASLNQFSRRELSV
jgi:hypothetical protein